MAKSSDETIPPTPTTDALPPAGGTTAGGSGARAVPGPGAGSVPARSGGGTGSSKGVAPGSNGSPTYVNGRPSTPGEMRREIQATRDRLSGTLDALEARIVFERAELERKKDELVDRATLKPVRDRLKREPWRAMAIAFVAGYVIAAIRD